MSARASLVEIFSSIQGEGPWVGTPTLFVRFGGCDLRCAWCDSPHTWRPSRTCRVERTRAGGTWREIANPVAVETVLAAAHALDVKAHRFASLTGGEPLLQPRAARALASALRATGVRVLLETHGLAHGALGRVVEHVDVVSMDWKLASDVRRAGEERAPAARPFHDEHERFLAVAREAPEVVVKMVVTARTADEEVAEAAARIARTAPAATLVVQPVTPAGTVAERPAPDRVLALAAVAADRVADVRVIPQTHPLLGIR